MGLRLCRERGMAIFGLWWPARRAARLYRKVKNHGYPDLWNHSTARDELYIIRSAQSVIVSGPSFRKWGCASAENERWQFFGLWRPARRASRLYRTAKNTGTPDLWNQGTTASEPCIIRSAWTVIFSGVSFRKWEAASAENGGWQFLASGGRRAVLRDFTVRPKTGAQISGTTSRQPASYASLEALST